MRQKVLIVKIGYTETIDNKIRLNNISLGDIFRTTAILHLFKNSNVTWLTEKKGEPLLAGNPFIRRLLIYGSEAVDRLRSEYFDTIVNLEMLPQICSLTDSIGAGRRYGFKFDIKKKKVTAFEHSYEALANSEDPRIRRRMTKNWIEMLYEMIGERWKGQGYILGYRPTTQEEFDIGFNTSVGDRWPNKAWPAENWHKLEDLAGDRYSVSYQESSDSIYGYIDWINRCRLIVTNDSLGLHLSIALKKKIIALFGPTSEKEVHMFGNGHVVRPSKRFKCMPCFSTRCKYASSCMHMISPDVIYETIKGMMG